MNMLLTSVGRRVKVVHYFRKEWEGVGKVFAVDCDLTAPALYAADAYEQVPRVDDPTYVPRLLAICNRYDVQMVLSLIDTELPLLARYSELFRENGIQIVASSAEAVNICMDKQATHDFLISKQIPCIPTYTGMGSVTRALEAGELRYPLMVKPRKGSASLGIRKAENLEELQHALSTDEEMVIQPFLSSVEYGVDAYVDLISGQPVSVFTRQKLRMRAGETDKSLAVKDKKLSALILDLLAVMPLSGPVDIDCFQMDDAYVISEINPRFGGGYPHAYECGENFMAYLLHNASGMANRPRIGQYREGSMMIKYDDVMMVGMG